MDHAAGAGTLCRKLPNLKVYVHENGAEHLANPERLVKSMLRVFGKEIADLYYGEACSQEQVKRIAAIILKFFFQRNRNSEGIVKKTWK